LKNIARESADPAEIVKTLANIVAIAKTREEARAIASKSPFINMENTENYIIGSPDEVAEKLLEYTELGVEHFILRFVDFPKTDGAKLFAEKVVPQFTS